MPKIHILAEQLANQIAAGEVVERPASVVKELVENSLDAGAERIQVEIEGGGTRLIRVIDDGSGMDEDDILLCFERHGTSKIKRDEDLHAIQSLGFRGEAIPSIASVAKVAVTSRTEEAQLGVKVHFDYGKLQKIHEVGCSKGTIFEVRNLFGNTPARKKFLRTHRTELGHIDEVVKNYALGCATTAISLHVNGKQSFLFTANTPLEERLRTILNYRETFISIGSPTPARTGRQVYGLLVPPERATASSSRMRLFINGRAIRDRLMSHAVFEGLRSFLLKGHSPSGYLHLTIPAEEVDVNVHPAKHEVRFRNSGDIHQFIKESVVQAMLDYQQRIRRDYFPQNFDGEHAHRQTADSSTVTHRQVMEKPEARVDRHPIENGPEKQSEEPLSSRDRSSFSPDQAAQMVQTAEPPPVPPTVMKQNSHPEPHIASDKGIRIIGQFQNLYIFCQSGDNLLVIDQHAAHERILFEKFHKQYVDDNVASQNLLFPQTVELSPMQIQLFESHQQEIGRMGFSVAEFGGNSYVISAVPAITGTISASEIFFDILDNFGKDGDRRTPGGKIEEILATMACKAAVKSGHSLHFSEIEALLQQMIEADLFTHCPHGRPVIKMFTPTEVKKWFHRT